MQTLGVSGLTSHTEETTRKYNRLLEQIGESGMLLQIERFLNAEDFEGLIIDIENNLQENGIEPASQRHE